MKIFSQLLTNFFFFFLKKFNILGQGPSNQLEVVNWPEISGTPISEFTTEGYVAMAFPTLFPFGDADLRQPRRKTIKPVDYFQHLMQYRDGRFARHSRFRFFAMNSLMRWAAMSQGRIFLQQQMEDPKITMDQLREMLENGENNIARKVVHFGASLRGTSNIGLGGCRS